MQIAFPAERIGHTAVHPCVQESVLASDCLKCVCVYRYIIYIYVHNLILEPSGMAIKIIQYRVCSVYVHARIINAQFNL